MTLTIRQLKIFALACLIPLTLVGCSGGPTDPNSASEPAAASAPPAVSDAAEEPVAPEPESSPAPQSSAGPVVPVEALKGPTGMGMAKLIADQAEATVPQFAINLRGTADEIAPEMIRGDLPIAAVPVNLAAVLNNKSEGKLKLAAINTLGVLYVVAKNQKVAQLSDLAGQTVYSTGKGTTPEYVFKYLLEQAGLTDKVKVEFLSEASEVAAHLTADDQAVAVLPEPYVTTVTKQDPSITIALDLSEAWQSAAGVPLVTGALVVNSEWAAAEPAALEAFLAAYQASVNFTNDQPDQAAQLIVEAGIVPKAPIAQAAIPRCHIVYLTGDEAKAAANQYLEVLFKADPASVGGSLPTDSAFYLQ